MDRNGIERLDGPAAAPDQEWLNAWWPVGSRAESGRTRDRAWSAALTQLRPTGGLGLLIDYGHLAHNRPIHGSLSAYRHGRSVIPAPSAELNLTAAVAVDSVAAAGQQAGATTLLHDRQWTLLPELLPDRPSADPLANLVRRSQQAALGAGRVWGDQWWLLQEMPPAGVVD